MKKSTSRNWSSSTPCIQYSEYLEVVRASFPAALFFSLTSGKDFPSSPITVVVSKTWCPTSVVSHLISFSLEAPSFPWFSTELWLSLCFWFVSVSSPVIYIRLTIIHFHFTIPAHSKDNTTSSLLAQPSADPFPATPSWLESSQLKKGFTIGN